MNACLVHDLVESCRCELEDGDVDQMVQERRYDMNACLVHDLVESCRCELEDGDVDQMIQEWRYDGWFEMRKMLH